MVDLSKFICDIETFKRIVGSLRLYVYSLMFFSKLGMIGSGQMTAWLKNKIKPVMQLKYFWHIISKWNTSELLLKRAKFK